ncbi:hypothetical protein LCL61_21200 [Amycolatopsis coloradensis]|uniref:Uncharacterized protein n=1 Tax=Amycolatopsis coloradensis TaxID=76021 RepID=A0ACD5BF76_9PSEU
MPGRVSANPCYRDTTSGPKCTHYDKKISKKKDIVMICQSGPLWDICVDRGVTRRPGGVRG